MTTLTNDQITAGAAVLCPYCGKAEGMHDHAFPHPRSAPSPQIAEKVELSTDEEIRAIAASRRAAPTASHGPLHLTNRKTADIAQRGYNIVGYVLRSEGGEEICISAESAVRWLPHAHYQRVMHEQDGSLFATPAPASAGQAAPAGWKIERANDEHYGPAFVIHAPDRSFAVIRSGAPDPTETILYRYFAAQPAEVSAGQAGQVATAAVLEEICDMQAKNYGDGMGTHLALIDLCDRARKILAAERAAAPAEQPSAQVKP